MAIDFTSVFRVFSRRKQNQGRSLAPLTSQFRQRFLMLLRSALLGNREYGHLPGDYSGEFYEVMRQKLLFHTGRPVLHSSTDARTEDEDTLRYLFDCPDSEFLDFIELAFGQETTRFLRVIPERNDLVRNVNVIFDADNLPYQLTDYIWEETTEHVFGQVRTGYRISHYPQVICREDEVLHVQAVEPTLRLLSQKGLESANDEFLRALADYRKGDYGDCLVKCASAFESTLKLICHRRKWSYKQTDTAAPLLKIYFDHSGLDRFFEQPLLLVGTIRNRLSTAHGAGAVPKNVPQHIARYAISSTAAAILLLTDAEWK